VFIRRLSWNLQCDTRVQSKFYNLERVLRYRFLISAWSFKAVWFNVFEIPCFMKLFNYKFLCQNKAYYLVYIQYKVDEEWTTDKNRLKLQQTNNNLRLIWITNSNPYKKLRRLIHTLYVNLRSRLKQCIPVPEMKTKMDTQCNTIQCKQSILFYFLN
jgi:hypothetical protein